MIEEWKDIFEYEGYYQVSSLGKIKSVLRVIPHSTSTKLTIQERMLIQTDRNGYSHVHLWKNNKEKALKVHRLVANAFIPNPFNLPLVNHKNGKKKDNHVSNLEWCTSTENNRHAFKTGLIKSAFGENAANAKFTDELVIVFRNLRNEGWQYKDISQKYGFSTAGIRACCIGRTWKHVKHPLCEFKPWLKQAA